MRVILPIILAESWVENMGSDMVSGVSVLLPGRKEDIQGPGANFELNPSVLG